MSLSNVAHAAALRACARIAPTWPLDRFIAVNPFWNLVDRPLPEVAAELQAASGATLLMPRAWYRREHREGRLLDRHLRAALEIHGASLTLPALRALLETDEEIVSPRSRVVDVVDAGRDLAREPAWRTFVTHSVSQFCAAHFDDGQSTYGPGRDGGLYASWRRGAPTDRSPGLLMGMSSYRSLASELPLAPDDLVDEALTGLGLSPTDHEGYLWSLLLDQNGWASWCAYRGWMAGLEGRTDDTLVDLLAVRLAWEWMLHRSGGAAVAARWKLAVAAWSHVDETAASHRADDWILQRAVEIAWREPVFRAVEAAQPAPLGEPVTAQLVFCIDVRSEVFRRSLEGVAPTVSTLGFAGFFALPIEYQPLGAAAARPQLPGLLAPRLRASDEGLGADVAGRRAQKLDLASTWRSFKGDAISTFTFVEALGLTYAAQLLAETLGLEPVRSADGVGLSAGEHAARKPRLFGALDGAPLEVEARRDLAANMLRHMSLTRGFARLVAFVGHGSATRNNPHAAGLDCGACGGQTGEVNARAAAALLRDPEVRRGLEARGVVVPETTTFVAALHNTTTDEVELFDLDELPTSHRDDVERLRAELAAAGVRARAERAVALGVEPGTPSAQLAAFRARASDWAQVRAEWGLANNAAFIAAPRARTRAIDLGGRAFLHEYRHEEDESGQVLELIMTAPMVVAHWINLQYYASTVDNLRYGSGNKVLHNVVGGHLGVFEGNGGDLRIGLPLQSLSDGERWVHTPLRLTVMIEAPREAIDAVLVRHAGVAQLVSNDWVALFQIDARDGRVHAKRAEGWVAELAS